MVKTVTVILRTSPIDVFFFSAKAKFGTFFGEYSQKLEGNVAYKSLNISHSLKRQRDMT